MLTPSSRDLERTVSILFLLPNALSVTRGHLKKNNKQNQIDFSLGRLTLLPRVKSSVMFVNYFFWIMKVISPGECLLCSPFIRMQRHEGGVRCRKKRAKGGAEAMLKK